MRFTMWPLVVAAILYGNSIFAQTLGPEPLSETKGRTQEPAANLTLDQALQLAISANPSLVVVQREVEAMAATRVQAGLFRNPEFSMEMEDTRASRRQTTYWFGQPFELGGKRAARIESAERAKDVATADLQVQLSETRGEVVQRFYEVLAAQERYRLAQSSMDLANRGLDIAGRRVTSGKVSPIEETRAKVASSGARIELTQANAELVNARRRLSALWGNPSPQFNQAEGELEILPNLPALSDLNALLEQSPQVLRAQKETFRRDAMLRSEEAKKYPDLILRGGVQRNESINDTVNVVGLAIALPIFDRNQGNIQEARVRVDKARDEQFETDVRLHRDIAQVHERLSAAIQEVNYIRNDILPGAQSALDATTKGFERGKFDFLDVLDAQRTLFGARGQYIRALGDVQRAVAEVEAILGPQGSSLFNASLPQN